MIKVNETFDIISVSHRKPITKQLSNIIFERISNRGIDVEHFKNFINALSEDSKIKNQDIIESSFDITNKEGFEEVFIISKDNYDWKSEDDESKIYDNTQFMLNYKIFKNNKGFVECIVKIYGNNNCDRGCCPTSLLFEESFEETYKIVSRKSKKF